jgi:pimeloyl-ACP methyl ester carboxylesterase
LSPARTWSLAGAVGLVGAAAVTGATVRATRVLRRRAALTGEEVALGSLRGQVHAVQAADGVCLYAEVDEPASVRPGTPTVVLAHGWGLTSSSWHYQRLALRETYRVITFDQRSHGRSEWSSPDGSTIEQLASDLESVITALAPTGPVALVGHSMGAMAIMALAGQAPDLVSERVGAIALVATSSGHFGRYANGLPASSLTRLSPLLRGTVDKVPWVVEAPRRLASDLAYDVVRRYGFGSSPREAHVAFADRMLAAAPVSVYTAFWPLFVRLDLSGALPAFVDLPTLIVVGERDVVTPPKHSRRLAEAIPTAELVVLPDSGHLLMLERNAELNELLEALLERAGERSGAVDAAEAVDR